MLAELSLIFKNMHVMLVRFFLRLILNFNLTYSVLSLISYLQALVMLNCMTKKLLR